MAYKIAGGTKWWQVRVGRGLEAEWIVMKDEYRRSEKEEKKYRNGLRKEAKERHGTTGKGMAEDVDEEVNEEGELDSGCKQSAPSPFVDIAVIPEMDKLRCMLYSELWSPFDAEFSSRWRILLGIDQYAQVYHLALRTQDAWPMLRGQLPK